MIRALAAMALLASAISGWAAPLDAVIAPERLWKSNGAEFMLAAEELGFEWTSTARNSARSAAGQLTVFGLPVVESIVRFDSDRAKVITLMLYARGDVGELPEETFDRLVRIAAERLNQVTGVRFVDRGKDPNNAVKAEGLIWTTDGAQYLLEYSKTREVKSRGIPFRAEFVRLEITPPEKKLGLLAEALSTAKPKFFGPDHVKKDPASRDVWIGDVPMVDQGEKGYCVVASVERVMRYYGGAVDQQELAQAVGASATGGTTVEAMYAALKKLGARLKVRVREVENTDIKDVLKLMADYNRAAKRASASPIPDQGNMIDLNAVYDAMDPTVFKEVRTKNRSGFSRFMRAVQSHINEGVPLLWTVALGKVAEEGIPQNAGGHMRLIIGYNDAKGEILYSDSWGAGHELKRMSAADAWTITTGAMSIEPF